MSESLDSIGIRNGTDKASVHLNPHDYLRHYEKFLSPIRNERLRILEIGVGGGESIRTWLEYFPNAQVVGVDIVGGTCVNDPRYSQVEGDQGSLSFWESFVRNYNLAWDVIIDDGCHVSGPVITSFSALWPMVSSGGLYIIEDLFCAHVAMYCTPGFPDHMSWIYGLMKDMNHGLHGIDHLHFSRELAIFKKA